MDDARAARSGRDHFCGYDHDCQIALTRLPPHGISCVNASTPIWMLQLIFNHEAWAQYAIAGARQP